MTYPRLLGQRYELGDLLGHGGMAEVHHGRDIRLGREVAIKVLRPDLARDPSFLTRFRREAQAAASLNHPSIVAVYDTGEDLGANDSDPTPYIVMEYVAGQTLRDILRAEGRLMPQRAMEITAEICGALDFSHRNGIVHRDVKPGNVMIADSGAVKVMDFGIARAMTDAAATVTATAQVIGTAQYLSPEQARGENVDARSDVYSTGCLLYELITGSPPFTGDSPVAVAYQHVREDPTPPSVLNPDVPPELDAIVLKAMAKNPVNRYQSAGEMQADLHRALAGATVYAEPVLTADERTTVLGATSTTGQLASAEEGRRRWPFVVLAVAVLAIIAGAVTAIVLLGNAGGNKIAVPDLKGLTQAQATDKLVRAGLRLGGTSNKTSTTALQNKVLSQQPGRDEKVKDGSQVSIVLGAGPNSVTVPDVNGKTLAQAEAALQQVGLSVAQQVQQQNSRQDKGTVLSSSPPQGQPARAGSSVTLTVSTGVLTLPNEVGRTASDVRADLVKAGFENIAITPQPNGSVSPGQIFQQDPQPGDYPPTQQITLLAATAPPTTTVPPTTTAPPPSSTPPSSTPPSSSPSPSPTATLPSPPTLPGGPGSHSSGSSLEVSARLRE